MAKKYEDEIYQFLLAEYKRELRAILSEPSSKERVKFSLEICHIRMCRGTETAGKALMEKPELVLQASKSAAMRALRVVFDDLRSTGSVFMKEFLTLRFANLMEPDTFSLFPGCEMKSQFISLKGVVVKTAKRGLLEFVKAFQCGNCKIINYWEPQKSRYYETPTTLDQCENGCIGSKPKLCVASEHDSIRKFKDYQEIKIQEQPFDTEFSRPPQTISVILEDDLCDTCFPGDTIIATGILFFRVKKLIPGKPIDGELALAANHLVLSNDRKDLVANARSMKNEFKKFWKQYERNPLKGRNIILRSFCPNVYGLYLPKLAFCIVIAGGISVDANDDQTGRKRGEAHLLLVGDPATGKSQLMTFASKLMPRSVFTTGTGSTTAGLTVGATKENGTWHLEAGALVLANGGICCIDEFGTMKDHDQASIHEVMEQQSISVAKAGMVSKISTKCSIIAACNPVKKPSWKYDPDDPHGFDENSGLPPSLVSRFDLILTLLDTPNYDWDNLICDFVLDSAKVQPIKKHGTFDKNKTLWDFEKLRAYFILIKEKTPTMTPEAETVLQKYFFMQRKSEKHNVSRTTPRLFESLIRLAEGHARLMFNDKVTVSDAVSAVYIVDRSMQSCAIFSKLASKNHLHEEYPTDELAAYNKQAEVILTAMNLHLTLRKEKASMNAVALLEDDKQPLPITIPVNEPDKNSASFAVVGAAAKENVNCLLTSTSTTSLSASQEMVAGDLIVDLSLSNDWDGESDPIMVPNCPSRESNQSNVAGIEQKKVAMSEELEELPFLDDDWDGETETGGLYCSTQTEKGGFDLRDAETSPIPNTSQLFSRLRITPTKMDHFVADKSIEGESSMKENPRKRKRSE